MAKTPAAPVPGNTVPPAPAPVADKDRKYARMVKARTRGFYGQMREEDEVFENTLDLSTYPEKATSWIEAVKD